MLDRSIYFSRDPAYKTPFGAVTLGQTVSMTLRPRREEGFTRGVLVAVHEFSGLRQEFPITRRGREGDRQVFTASFSAPMEPELIWYYFVFYLANGGSKCLGKNGYCDSHEVDCWQLTVYDGSHKTPAWFGEGVTYQIFPDRFRRTYTPDPAGMIGDRWVHHVWDELMEYRPNERGEILNRDFFGGNIPGIIEKLPYLKSLGVSTIYLCPIFEASSNHRYNTGDYRKLDPMLGTDKDLQVLCERAHEMGIRIMLDGVFNHNGSDSRYFNARGYYPTVGAAQSQRSPYYGWFNFRVWPWQYDSWWGISTLPSVNEGHPDYVKFIIEDDDSVIRHWLRMGADAWRLDVADELPDWFIEKIRAVMEEEKPDSFLLGEVWEDGSNKIAYSQRRRYLLGRETHGLMNYPFRSAALAYLQGGPAADFMEQMETLRENYPHDAYYSTMNMLGTHDNPRILTLLGAAPPYPLESRDQRAHYRMSAEEYRRGTRRLMLGGILLYAFPGSPMLYYGDEAGMEGFEDPFNRGTFPWGRENTALQAHFRTLGRLRQSRPSLRKGDIRYLHTQGQVLVFSRTWEEETTVAVLNAGFEPVSLELDWSGSLAEDAITGQKFLVQNGKLRLVVPLEEGLLLI